MVGIFEAVFHVFSVEIPKLLEDLKEKAKRCLDRVVEDCKTEMQPEHQAVSGHTETAFDTVYI